MLKIFVLQRLRSQPDLSFAVRPLKYEKALKFKGSDRFAFGCDKKTLLADDGSAPGILSEVRRRGTISRSERLTAQSKSLTAPEVDPALWEAWLEFRSEMATADAEGRIVWGRYENRMLHDLILHWRYSTDGVELRILDNGEVKEVYPTCSTLRPPQSYPNTFGSAPISTEELCLLEGIVFNGGMSIDRDALQQTPQVNHFNSETFEATLSKLMKKRLVESEAQKLRVSWDIYSEIESP